MQAGKGLRIFPVLLCAQGSKLADMAEKQTFFFEVKYSDGSTHAVKVKAADLITAKDCIEEHPTVISAKHVEESEIPDDVRAKITDSVDCPPRWDFPYVGYKPT